MPGRISLGAALLVVALRAPAPAAPPDLDAALARGDRGVRAAVKRLAGESFGGNVPTVFFSDSTGGCSHTTGDRWRVVDRRNLARQTRIGLHVTALLADAATPPPFRAPNPALATFADARSVLDAFTRAQGDLLLFTPGDRVLLDRIQRDLTAVVAAGPEVFGPEEVGVVLNAALQGIGALTRLPCRAYHDAPGSGE